jgi:hypothetical protein
VTQNQRLSLGMILKMVFSIIFKIEGENFKVTMSFISHLALLLFVGSTTKLLSSVLWGPCGMTARSHRSF